MFGKERKDGVYHGHIILRMWDYIYIFFGIGRFCSCIFLFSVGGEGIMGLWGLVAKRWCTLCIVIVINLLLFVRTVLVAPTIDKLELAAENNLWSRLLYISSSLAS